MNSSNPFSMMMNMMNQGGPGMGIMPRNPMAQMIGTKIQNVN